MLTGMDNSCNLVKHTCHLCYNFLRYTNTLSLHLFYFPVPRSRICLVLQSSIERDGGIPSPVC